VRVLNRVKFERAVPKVLFCDNGSEFTSQAMVWLAKISSECETGPYR
jgi:hypothetical protein